MDVSVIPLPLVAKLFGSYLLRLSHQINVKQGQEEEPAASEIYETIGLFLAQWVLFEQRFRDLGRARGYSGSKVLFPTGKLVLELGLLPQEKIPEFERIRRLRNDIVHGTGTLSVDDIREATSQLQRMIRMLPHPQPTTLTN